MKKINLKALNIRNFKGILERQIQFNGSTNIFGANESTKSTIYTAFNWLLTGKDEFDRADYEIKNTFRKELNSQAHEVEGIFEVDGKEVILKRVYLEDWVKPKGQSTKVFKGHHTDYYFNDVPCSAKEYQENLENIIPTKIIKLITNPYYFNTLKWDDQRRGLLAIAGDISNNEIFETIDTPEKDYGTLIMVLNSGKTPDQWKKELAAKKQLLKKAAVEFGPRIDEVKRNQPDAHDWEELQRQIDNKVASIKSIDEELENVAKTQKKKQDGIILMQNDKHDKETKLGVIRQRVKTTFLAIQGSNTSEIVLLQQEIAAIERGLFQLEKSVNDNADNKAAYQTQIADKQLKVDQLRSDWDSINKETFVFDESKCECPTCKQSLPATEIAAKKSELQKNFNQDVLSRKKAKVDESDLLKAEIGQLNENIAAIDQVDITPAIAEQKSKLETAQTRLASLQEADKNKAAVNVEEEVEKLLKSDTEAIGLIDEINLLVKAIEEAGNTVSSTDTSSQKAQKSTLQLELKELEKKMAVKETTEKTNQRIEDLLSEESANAQAIADLELQEFEVESYTRAKMDILERRVNSKFKYVQFRLWHKQVDGGIDEDCVCEYKGVPYPTLNTAAKLFAGIDVLNTFSNYYEIMAPVFCDNRESVTYIPDTNLQIISLFVSPEDKNIRVEAA